ncbi:MAG TPA: DHH family phosphoesterase [Candidatus Dojkabacteria bacterium]|nr:DHH family phosphoesterase [Candidatus Dojkabacteria bacterium]
MDNSKLIYITADGLYSDIDIYACSIAYAELLRLRGKNAIAVVNTTFTESVPQFLLDLDVEYLNQSNIDWNKADALIILDRSDSEGLQKNINISKVIELYDHHFGYEEYWSKLLGSRAHIEKVGSCATLIWEQIKLHNQEKKISKNSLILLYLAIISNTLNFKSGVTTDRDIQASKEIKIIANIPNEFSSDYFKKVSTSIINAPYEAMLKDVKFVVINGSQQIAIGQLEIWDAKEIQNAIILKLETFLPNFENIPWFVTIASIKDGKTILISKSTEMKIMLNKALSIKWEEDISYICSSLLLRKEIIKALQKVHF